LETSKANKPPEANSIHSDLSAANQKLAARRREKELQLRHARERFYALAHMAEEARNEALKTVQTITQVESEAETKALEARNAQILAEQHARQLAEQEAKAKSEAQAKARTLALKR